MSYIDAAKVAEALEKLRSGDSMFASLDDSYEFVHGLPPRDAELRHAIILAIAAERERCAKIAETQIEANASHGCEYEYELAAQIAARIRSGE